MKEAGLITERGRQRTDSSYVLAAVRELTRLELVSEAVRAALEILARDAPHLLDGIVDEEWAICYGRPVQLGGQPTRPQTRMKQAGADACLLLRRTIDTNGSRLEGLRQIFVQNFLLDASGRPGHAPSRMDYRQACNGSSLPMTWRPAGRDAATPAGPATSSTSPRPATRTASTWSPTWPPLCPPTTSRRSRTSIRDSRLVGFSRPNTWPMEATSRSRYWIARIVTTR
jgi:hypothetical protein